MAERDPIYARELRDAFLAQAQPEAAIPMAEYMRHQFPFFGLKKGPREMIQREFFGQHGLPSAEELPKVLAALWRYPERECQYAGLAICWRLVNRKRSILDPAASLPVFEKLVTQRSWWDTVDAIASKLVGWALREDLALRASAIARYRVSPDMWLRRTALLFQLRYKTATDAELLFALCRENLADKEFFIRKAIGWALRELSKTDGPAVVAFVEAQPQMSGLSRREALKWLSR